MKKILLGAIIALLAAAAAPGDEIVKKNGARIRGKVVEQTPEEVVIKVSFRGGGEMEMRVPMKDIRSITVDGKTRVIGGGAPATEATPGPPSGTSRRRTSGSSGPSRKPGGRPTDTSAAGTSDWPMWHCEPGRSGVTPHELPASMVRKWVREFAPPSPAWPSEPRQHYDLVYEPVVVGGTLFVGLHNSDKLTALNAETGAEEWSFYVEGPVRLAPVYWKGRVIFGSDDGYAYCLDATSGRLLWKRRLGPSDHTVLGNGRLISSWPVRGGPVLVDGTVYFGAGIWPFMGVHLYALDAATGKVVWKNGTTGSAKVAGAHGSNHVGGPSPQGYLVAVGDRLLIPSGRARPATLDRKTGKMLPYYTGWKGGNSYVVSNRKHYFNGGYMFDLATGGLGHSLGGRSKAWDLLPIVTGDTVYVGQATIRAYDIRNVSIPDNIGDHSYEYKIYKGAPPSAWKGPSVAADTVWLKAGRRLYVSKGSEVMAVDLSGGKVSWKGAVEGRVGGMIAARGKLYVSTREGRLYCFGRGGGGKLYAVARPKRSGKDAWTKRAAAILKATGVTEGYCLVMGLEDGRLVEELARQSDLHVIGLDGDEDKIDAIRRRLDGTGLYGRRLALRTGDPMTFPLPPYIASLIVSERPAALGSGAARKVFYSLRPYGGVACMDRGLSGSGLASAETKKAGNFSLLIRAGKLPDAANWTHEGADAGNTYCSRDKLVKLPLGMLWFGNPAGAQTFYDNSVGAPRPQVAGGRLIVEGPGVIHATDIYTGRLLWEAKLPGMRAPFPPPQKFKYTPRATSVLGGSYVSLPDAVYVRYGRKCLRLDPATGQTVKEFSLPGNADWGYIGVWEDLLIAGASPLQSSGTPGKDPWNLSSSEKLVVMDRESGKVLWSKDAAFGFRHHAIALGGGMLFCIDRLPGDMLAKLKRRGGSPGGKPRLIALDIRTGKERWSATQDVVGSWVGYSAEHGVVVQAADWTVSGGDYKGGSKMTAYQSKSGKVLWSRPMRYWSLGDFGMIHRDALIAGGRINLKTGKGMAGWGGGRRSKGCATMLASEHLLLFRSSTAACYDLEKNSGLHHLSGFRSACSTNLIVAGGVLSAPRTFGPSHCDCNYSNQTSLGLIHMPELEKWNPGWRN